MKNLLKYLMFVQLPFLSIGQELVSDHNMKEMNRLKYTIDIKASKSKIWSVLWDDRMYRTWAGVFYEGSYALAQEDWKEGSKVLFLGPGQNGIYSIIETHIPNEKIQFRHIGNVLNGKEQPIDEDSGKWSGATEVYSLTNGTNLITLTIGIDVLGEHLDFMKTKLPLALEKIRSLSEKK